MKKYSILVFVFLFFASVNFSASLKIVTTTSDLASIAKEIGGNLVEIVSIAKGYEDPHHITAKPSYILKANKADLWITVGMDLEVGWEPLILSSARNSDIMVGSSGYLDCSQGIKKLEIPAVIDRSLGDVHPAGNPHYWLDPYNGGIIAEEITDRLSRIDPSNSRVYNDNLAAFEKRLDEKMFGKDLIDTVGGQKLWKMSNDGTLDEYCEKNGVKPDPQSWYAKMKNLRGMKYVAYHKMWIYFNNRFGLEAVEHLEPKPGIQPSPSHLSKIMDIIKNNNIKLIVQSVYNNPQAGGFLKEKTGITVLTLPTSTGGTEKAATYFDLFDILTAAFSEASAQQAR